MPPRDVELIELLQQVRDCRHCAHVLGHEPRPVVRVAGSAKILIVGQAPGTRVHASGVPWDDPSGDRLRAWLGLGREAFYDDSKIAIMPMGFCYPGRGRSGDLPPRPECAPRWHEKLLRYLPDLALTLLVGRFAQQYYLEDGGATVADTIRDADWESASQLPLVHPSPRNRLWLRKQPWFEASYVPVLRRRVQSLLTEAGEGTKD